MIPLRDNIPSRTTPLVNYTIIAICGLVFLLQLSGGPDSTLAERFGFVPLRMSVPNEPIAIQYEGVVNTPLGPRSVTQTHVLPPAAIDVTWTLLTCMFLHGGWMHFLGNMWFLWIFGDNVEDRLGHVGYALLYVGTGVAAGLAHYYADSDSPVPTIGASGAIAGVMGAYALFYPRAMVLSIIPIVIFVQMVVLPAPVFLGIWFIFQVLQSALDSGGLSGGVAWWAHIGGFIAGAAVAFLVEKSGWAAPPVDERYPRENHVGFYRP